MLSNNCVTNLNKLQRSFFFSQIYPEARSYSVKKVFLKISQILQENTIISEPKHSLCEKCPNTDFFLVRIQSEFKRKYGPEKTPYLDTFHAVT